MEAPFNTTVPLLPSQAPEAPSVTQAATHIGDPGTRRCGIRQFAQQPAEHYRGNAGGWGAAGEAGEGRERQGWRWGARAEKMGAAREAPVGDAPWRAKFGCSEPESTACSCPGRPGRGPAGLSPLFLMQASWKGSHRPAPPGA